MSDKSREAKLRRKAKQEGLIFRKARRVFVEGGVETRYYVSDMANTLRACYSDLDAAEEDFSKESTEPVSK
jgi:hypothetical protein